MKNIIFLILVIGLGFVSCETEEAPKTLYEKIEREELSKGIRKDSLFLGLTFGLKKSDFFLHCSDMNKDSIIAQGMEGKPELHLKEELKYSCRMIFYPDFYDEKIWKIPVKFTYDAWAPWNRDYDATKLRSRVADLLMDWHGGNEFVKIPHQTDTTALVKIDGNRRILIERDGAGSFVKATYTDLTIEKELIKQQKARREEEEGK
jgi:hypothetical protein